MSTSVANDRSRYAVASGFFLHLSRFETIWRHFLRNEVEIKGLLTFQGTINAEWSWRPLNY